jgi:hypothetical protein
MIEIEDGRGVPRTLRAYPRSGDVWRLREATASGRAGGPAARPVRAWRLRLR